MSSHFFIDRPIFASVLSIIIVVLGLVSLQKLPVAQFPQITPPMIQIEADYPGASAEVVAESVARPIEVQLPGIDNLLYYDSTSTNDGHMTPCDGMPSSARRRFLLAVGAGLGFSQMHAGDACATGPEEAFEIYDENTRLPLTEDGAAVIKKAYDLGRRLHREHGGCCRCTVAALQEALDMVPNHGGLFRAATCLDGGAAPGNGEGSKQERQRKYRRREARATADGQAAARLCPTPRRLERPRAPRQLQLHGDSPSPGRLRGSCAKLKSRWVQPM